MTYLAVPIAAENPDYDEDFAAIGKDKEEKKES